MCQPFQAAYPGIGCHWLQSFAAIFHQLSEGVGLHLLRHFAAVSFDRDFGYAESPADLFIQQTRNHQGHHLPFTMCEQRVRVPERLDLRLATKCGLAALDGVSDDQGPRLVLVEVQTRNLA